MTSDSTDYAGEFEVHLTVRCESDGELARFRDRCDRWGVKCIRIVLSRGEHTEQPMATWRRAATTLPVVREEADARASELTDDGFEVTRVKIETAPHNDGVPRSDADAVGEPSENYFEHHIKLRRRSDAPTDRLRPVCETHAAHLSRNAFREAADGIVERFVTQRSYGIGRERSIEQRDHLLAVLDDLGEEVIEVESEYCVYDSHVALDAGWLPSP